MGVTFPQWRGFELAPRGYLLEQVIDIRGDMGIAYERMAEFQKNVHTHDRLSFVCPRGACAMDVGIGSGTRKFNLSSRHLLVLPRGKPHDIRARSSVFDALALYPAGPHLERVARENGIPRQMLEHFAATVRRLERSPWLDQLLVEYFSRRVLRSGKGVVGMSRLRFFEAELTREVFRIAGLWQAKRSEECHSASKESVAERALRFIEANLFAPLDLDAIAAHAHASASTLLRHFARRTGVTPLKYARARRLDEARALLKNGTHSIAAVAVLVGYEHPGAFCEAFRARFGKPPSRDRTLTERRSPKATR